MNIQIDSEYNGDRYAAIIYTGKRYKEMVRSSSEAIDSDLPLLREGEAPQVKVRYEGINIEALKLINLAVEDLNMGKTVNLENLLNGKEK